MGIPGLLKEIGKGDRVALAKLAFEHFEKHNRPLRIAIDAAIWNFQTQFGGQGGKNPALRTLYFRLLRLLALPIHPVFVYDGKNKPLTKRGKTVSRYGTCVPAELSKNLVARFRFPHHVAPGEAEAECAFLQKNGVVDAVMTQDVDAIMFGSTLTFRDWSKEGTKGNNAPTHVSVLNASKVKEQSGLDQAGMILVALLSGGDYHEGVPGFGPGLSCQVARAGFGQEMIELVRNNDGEGLREWRERLQYELESNESGYFAKRHKTVKVPDDFPNRTILSYYLNPAVSKQEDLAKLERRWLQWWDRDIDIVALRDYVGMTFDWLYKKGATYFIRSLAQPLFQHRLKTKKVEADRYTIKDIKERRKHFVNDGIPELRMSMVPVDVVGIDLDAEEEDPEFAELEDEGDETLDIAEEAPMMTQTPAEVPSSPSKRRKQPPWNPSLIERWWVPETLLKVGLPNLVAEWEQEQEAIRSDPIRFAARKCKPTARGSKKIDRNMKDGALDNFMPVTKKASDITVADQVFPPRLEKAANGKGQPLARSRSNPLATFSSQDANVQAYFRPGKRAVPTKEATQDVIQICQESVQHEAVGPVLIIEHSAALPVQPNNSISQLLNSCLEDLELLNLEEAGMGRKDGTPPRTLSSSKTRPHLVKNASEHEMSHAKLPKTVTQRRKRQGKDQLVGSESPRPAGALQGGISDDDEVIFVDSRRTPPPISSFFGANASKETGSNLSQMPIDVVESPLVAQTALMHTVGKRAAVSRDSLPGTWKMVPLTPSQSSSIDFVDLTKL